MRGYGYRTGRGLQALPNNVEHRQRATGEASRDTESKPKTIFSEKKEPFPKFLFSVDNEFLDPRIGAMEALDSMVKDNASLAHDGRPQVCLNTGTKESGKT